MTLLRRFLPFKTTIQWPSSQSVAAWGARQLHEEEEDMNEFFQGGWNVYDSFAIIAGMLDPDEEFDWATQDEFNFPKFAYMDRSSFNSELILRLRQEQASPPIFPITAQALMVGFWK